MTSNKDVVTPSTERLVGRVKWFNNKAGYGFITVTDGSRSGSDIFIHHSAIEVENQQYKYLVQGEYVEFELVKTTSVDHEWQASSVNGINGGKLMCETRHEYKLARTAYKTEKGETTTESDAVSPREVPVPTPRQQRVPRDASTPRQQRAPRVRGEGPREGDKKEWTLVSSKSDSKGRNVRSRAPRQSAAANTNESK